MTDRSFLQTKARAATACDERQLFEVHTELEEQRAFLQDLMFLVGLRMWERQMREDETRQIVLVPLDSHEAASTSLAVSHVAGGDSDTGDWEDHLAGWFPPTIPENLQRVRELLEKETITPELLMALWEQEAGPEAASVLREKTMKAALAGSTPSAPRPRV